MTWVWYQVHRSPGFSVSGLGFVGLGQVFGQRLKKEKEGCQLLMSAQEFYDTVQTHTTITTLPNNRSTSYIRLPTTNTTLILRYITNTYSHWNMKLKKQYCFGTFCDTKILFAGTVKPTQLQNLLQSLLDPQALRNLKYINPILSNCNLKEARFGHFCLFFSIFP